MKKASSRKYAPKGIGVKTVSTDELHPNPHNPRLLFDKEPLAVLEDSINTVGILVPLTVYRDRGTNRLTILDGQRRWICAQHLGLSKVPVNEVAEPTLVQNIVTMFQIHKLREDWQLMPTALKLELLMNKLQERNEKRLSELTGLDPAVVQRCKKLISYPKQYQDMMLDPDPQKRVKADFFIELYPVLHDRLVSSFKWFKKNKITDNLLYKYQTHKGGLKAVTDFRTMKQHISSAHRAKKGGVLNKRLREYIESDDLTLDHLEISSASVKGSARKLVRDIARLESSIDSVDVETFYGEEQFWGCLESLYLLIQRKLREAGRRIPK